MQFLTDSFAYKFFYDINLTKIARFWWDYQLDCEVQFNFRITNRNAIVESNPINGFRF